MSKVNYLEAARVLGTHGVRGMVRLENLTDSPEVLAKIGTLYLKKEGIYVPLTSVRASVYKGAVLEQFDEISSLDDAIPLKGEVLYAARSDLPLADGSHFVADMLGLPVIDESLGTVGTLSDVIAPAGRQIYVVKSKSGSEFMIPAVPEFILDITTEGNSPGIRVRLIPGMMPEEPLR